MEKHRFLSPVLAGALALSLASPALAAPTEGIAVQLDGKDLTFTDAAPQARDGRTFLPFRAVFEAMGAQVGYDAAANAVSATRGDTTVTMTLGSTQATVKTGGFESLLTMDVAPFAENNRTYVPVRFAAQALGCAVGWDQDDQTVILVDCEKLAAEATAAHEYTLWDQFFALNRRYDRGNWAFRGGLEGHVSIQGLTLPLDGTFEVLTADGAGVEMGLELSLDPAAPEPAVTVDLRGDWSTGRLYLLPGGTLAERVGCPAGSWIFLDCGIPAGTQDFPRLLAETAPNGLPVLDDKDTANLLVRAAIDEAAALVADSAFTRDGDDYTVALDYEGNGTEVSLTLALDMAQGTAAGYSLRWDGRTAETGPFHIAAELDRADHIRFQAQLALETGEDLDLELKGAWTPTDKAPRTVPPDGAQVADVLDLFPQTALQPFISK